MSVGRSLGLSVGLAADDELFVLKSASRAGSNNSIRNPTKFYSFIARQKSNISSMIKPYNYVIISPSYQEDYVKEKRFCELRIC